MAAEGSERARSVPFPDDMRIGDWLLQPSIDRLSRNGTSVHLRPQLTNLLVLLAQNAGRTVSKDEILSKVWEGQFVAESGMTRCIAEIRQALGDDARDPKIVQTITKRGYRLMAPVARVEPTGGRRTGERPAAASAEPPATVARARCRVGACSDGCAGAARPSRRRPEPAPPFEPATRSGLPAPVEPAPEADAGQQRARAPRGRLTLRAAVLTACAPARAAGAHVGRDDAESRAGAHRTRHRAAGGRRATPPATRHSTRRFVLRWGCSSGRRRSCASCRTPACAASLGLMAPSARSSRSSARWRSNCAAARAPRCCWPGRSRSWGLTTRSGSRPSPARAASRSAAS